MYTIIRYTAPPAAIESRVISVISAIRTAVMPHIRPPYTDGSRSFKRFSFISVWRQNIYTESISITR